jgi:hypothetical protein
MCHKSSFVGLALLSAIIGLFSCGQPEVSMPAVSPMKEPTAMSPNDNVLSYWPDTAVAVTVMGGITLFGKSTELAELQKSIEAVLLTIPNLPNTIPVQFEHQVTMSTRSSVLTKTENALKAVQKARLEPVLSVINTSLSKELGLAVSVDPALCKQVNNHVFIIGRPMLSSGAEIDYTKTSVAKQYQSQKYVPGVFALLEKVNGVWNSVVLTHGAADIPSKCWWKTYQAPKELFHSSILSADCK